MASNSRSRSTWRRAIAAAAIASRSRSDASELHGARSRISHPCAADSSTPSRTLSARAIHPLAATTLPRTDTCRNASHRASSAASARRPRRSYSANARSFSSIARACSPPNCIASPRPSRTSALSPNAAACSNTARARSQSATPSASRPRRTSSSAVATPIAARVPTRELSNCHGSDRPHAWSQGFRVGPLASASPGVSQALANPGAGRIVDVGVHHEEGQRGRNDARNRFRRRPQTAVCLTYGS